MHIPVDVDARTDTHADIRTFMHTDTRMYNVDTIAYKYLGLLGNNVLRVVRLQSG